VGQPIIDIGDVKVGDAILVRVREVVPVDGLIVSLRAVVDEVIDYWR
jgi:cation transport ATPase